MANKRHKPEEIVTKLRQVDVLVGQGMARVAVGKYLYALGQLEPSTKKRGQRIKVEAPNLDQLDPALRTYCKRLYSALAGYRDADILEVLGVSDIRDYYTSNPTVIIRDYRERKAAAQAN
jgi:hypothetical protein